MSLDDQVDQGKEVVAECWPGPVEYRVIATTGKGEALDRSELAEIEAAYRSGELDLFVFCPSAGQVHHVGLTPDLT
jgi:hypothetical protein